MGKPGESLVRETHTVTGATPGSQLRWPHQGAWPPAAEDRLSRAQKAVSLRYPPSVPLHTSSDEHVLTFSLQTKITAGIKHINRNDSRNTKSMGLVTKGTQWNMPACFFPIECLSLPHSVPETMARNTGPMASLPGFKSCPHL